MSQTTWNATVAPTKLKQHEVVTIGDSIKLKEEGSNFDPWLESQASHCSDIEMESIIMIGQLLDITTPHEIHDMFTVKSNLFDTCGQVAIEQVTLLST